MKDVAQFFDEQQKGSAYRALKALTENTHRAVADIMNSEVRGRVLSIGGVWDFFVEGPDLTVLDVSAEMLKSYAPGGAAAVAGDLFAVDFPPDSFDTAVFALVLHHVAQGDWASCRGRVEEALARARRWLKPGGRVFIIEACPAPAWMAVQRVLLPLTRIFLRLAGQPLVVMHDRAYYESVLRKGGFDGVCARRVDTGGEAGRGAWHPVFMSVSWLKIPLKFYPKMHVITGVKPARAQA